MIQNVFLFKITIFFVFLKQKFFIKNLPHTQIIKFMSKCFSETSKRNIILYPHPDLAIFV